MTTASPRGTSRKSHVAKTPVVEQQRQRQQQSSMHPIRFWLYIMCLMLSASYLRYLVWLTQQDHQPSKPNNFLNKASFSYSSSSLKKQQQDHDNDDDNDDDNDNDNDNDNDVPKEIETEIEGPDGILLTVKIPNPEFNLRRRTRKQQQPLPPLKNIQVIVKYDQDEEGDYNEEEEEEYEVKEQVPLFNETRTTTRALAQQEEDDVRVPVETRIRRHRKHKGQAFNHPTAIFFNVYINPQEVTRSFKIAREQLRQVNQSAHQKHGSVVHMNMIGGRVSMSDLCEGYDLQCALGKHYPLGANEEVTLHDLWQYCRANVRHRVTYLHNKGSYRYSVSNTKLRRLATTSALSAPCLRIPLHKRNYPCNQCGLTFHTTPYFHWTANIWTAECSYVQHLSSPLEYEQHRWNLYQHIRNNDNNTECLPELNETMVWSHSHNALETNYSVAAQDEEELFLQLKQFGLGRYAMERWIVSHPSMLPCDVTPLKLSRFQRGFESWFTPKLRIAKYLTVLEDDDKEGLGIPPPLRNESTQNIYWMIQEYNKLYAPNERNISTDTLRAYVSYLEPIEPCVE